MQKTDSITVCRLSFQFLPLTGGSIVHTIELARHINPYCERQFLIVPRADVDTKGLDKSFPFLIYRVKYCRFRWLYWLKGKNWFRWLPLAPFVVFSYGIFTLPVIYKLNRKHGIDIIHAHGFATGAIATVAGKLIRKPVVWMMHGTAGAYSAVVGKFESFITKLFAPNHCLVLDDGSPAPEKFTKLLKGKVTIVYHAIDTNVFYPKEANIELLHELGLRDDHFILISAHSLISVKGIDYAISAFAEFLRICQAPNAILLILGVGQLRNQLEEIGHKLDISTNILFPGGANYSQIPDYLSISDIAIATSIYSNMNRSVQESMSCGKPVVAFNSGNTDRLIIDMENGLLSEPGNIADMARKIQILYRNPGLRQEIGENARKFIEQNRSWNRRIEAEINVYKNLPKSKQ